MDPLLTHLSLLSVNCRYDFHFQDFYFRLRIQALAHWKIYYYSIEINFFGGEHKVITPKQQILGIILCVFYVFKMAVAIAFLCENAVEAI